MRRIALGFLTALLASSAFANEIRTIKAGQTAQVDLGATQAVAIQDATGGVVQLTVLVKDADGDVLRSRIVLRDGQGHTVTLAVDDDANLTHSYAFVRNGDVIDLWARSVDKRARLASR